MRFKKSYFYTISAFLIPLIVYIYTLAPSVLFGDSGELITAAKFLGIPHPPGSPIWVALAHLFTYIPVGSIAYRINLSSAFFASVSIAILYLVMRDLLRKVFEGFKFSEIVALSISLTFAFTLPFWTQSLHAEVYTLNILFSVAAIYLTFKYLETQKIKLLFFLGLIFGLGLTNHYLLLLVMIPAGLSIIIFNRSIFRNPRGIGLGLLGLVLGISFFGFLTIRSHADPVIDWGNPETLESTLAVIRRDQFSTNPADVRTANPLNLPVKKTAGAAGVIERTMDGVGDTVRISYEAYFVLILLAIPGGYFLYKQNRKYFWLFLLLFLVSGALMYTAIDYDFNEGKTFRFITSLNMLLSLSFFIAVGVVGLIKLLPKEYYNSAFLTLLIPACLILVNVNTVNMRENDTAYLHAKNMLDLVEPNSVIFAEENNWLFPLLYLTTVEGYRDDVTIYDRNGNLFNDIYTETRKDFRSTLDFERKRRVVEDDLVSENPDTAYYYAADKTFENYRYEDVYPMGILYSLGVEREVDKQKVFSNILNKDIQTYENQYTSHYMIAYYNFQYAEMLRAEGNLESAREYYLKAAEWAKNDARMLNNIAIIFVMIDDLDSAEKTLEQAISVNPNREVTHNTLGIIYMRTGRPKDAEKAFLRAIEINGRYVRAIINLGRAYHEQGDIPNAAQYYQIALSLDPNNEEVQYYIQLLQESVQQQNAEK